MREALIVDFDFALARHEQPTYEILDQAFQHIKMPLLVKDENGVDITNPDIKNLPTRFFRVGFVSYVASAVEIDNTDDIDLSIFNLVVIITTEVLTNSGNYNINEYIVRARSKFCNNNIIVVCGGALNYQTRKDVFIYPSFLLNTANTNTFIDTNLFPKPKLFDALLGLNKPHRRMILDYLQNSGLITQTFASLLKYDYHDPRKEFLYYSEELYDLESVSARQCIEKYGAFNSYHNLNSSGVFNWISSQVPFNIYQLSYYSIIAETLNDGPVFFTEKIAKPLYAKRLFVVFSSMNYLSELHKFGFKTFNGIIDESYDQIENEAERHNAACRELLKLSKLDPIEVYQTIEPIIEHNHKLIQNREYFINPMREWLFSHFYL